MTILRDPRDRIDPRRRLEDPRDVARRELREGEELIWADRPHPSALRKRSMATFYVAIPFTAFACFWLWGASQAVGTSALGTVFPLFGLPFLFIGLWMLSGPWRTAKEAVSTIYAITNQRLMICRTGRSRSVQSFGPPDISKIERSEHPGGLGDVVFAEDFVNAANFPRKGFRIGKRPHVEDVGFFGIADAREVEAEIAKLRRSLQPEGASSVAE